MAAGAASSQSSVADGANTKKPYLGRRGKGEEARGLTGDQSPDEDLVGAVLIC
jgi:hypothetical protein